MSSRVKGLDGLRGLAAIAVVAHHTTFTGTSMGEVAVHLFLVLSGFLLVGNLHASRAAMERGETRFGAALLAFWRNRALRIFPAYYAVVVVAAAAEVAMGRDYLYAHLAWYATFTQNILIGFVDPSPLNMAQTWTIAVENQCYVLLALFLLCVPASSHRQACVWGLGLSLAACALTRGTGLGDLSARMMPAYGFAFLCAGGVVRLRGARGPELLGHPVSTVLALVGMVVVTVPAFHTDSFDWSSVGGGGALSLMCCAFLIGHLHARQDGALAVILESPVARWLGALSYGVYLLHVPIVYGCMKPVRGRLSSLLPGSPFVSDLLTFMVVLCLSLAAAFVLWVAVERPFLRLKASSGPSGETRSEGGVAFTGYVPRGLSGMRQGH